MKFTIQHEREEDGRSLAKVPEVTGVLAYGATSTLQSPIFQLCGTQR